MSTQPEVPASGSALPDLTLNLSSNNPFRNRAISPGVPSPRSPFDDPPPRPLSRNPFLDPGAKPLLSPENMASTKAEPTAEELFNTLTIDDGRKPEPAVQQGQRLPMGPPPPVTRRAGPNVPSRGRGPSSNHRPTRSQEEDLRSKIPGPRLPTNTQRGGKQPQHRTRPRSNSDTSLASPEKQATDEERKKARAKKGKQPQPSKKRDAIDLLDFANVYGVGGVFHHDGPYDALNPHRNRKGSRRAPMQAFPEGSLNNTLGGAGPLVARADHAAFMGNNDPEAFRDYGSSRDRAPRSRGEPPIFDPRSRGSVVYGDESLGLGPSTFLEGTPASRTAIERRQVENQQETQELAFKRQKSVAHRAKRLVYGGEGSPRTGPMTNPEGVYAQQRSPTEMPSRERNPFFNEFDKSNEDQISVSRGNENPLKSPTSPKASFGLERRSTTDATSPDRTGQKSGGGLLARVKSLKGSKRQKPERPAEPSPAMATEPGTAV